MEDFKPIKSTDGIFGINRHGKVKNLKTGRLLSTYLGIDLYEHVVLCMKGRRYRKRVHRLMAEAYLNNCSVVDHIDGNKSNNDLTNLRAVTHSENIAKAYRENTYVNPHGGRGIWIVVEDKETGERTLFKSLRACERFTGVDRHRINTFLKGKRNNLTNFNFYYDE